MSRFTTPLEEVMHHNVIKNNKTGGPALAVGQMKLLWRALGENTGYTFSIFEMTVVPGMGKTVHDLDAVMASLEQLVQQADPAMLLRIAPTIERIGTHTAYHTGQIFYVRKLQGSWKLDNDVNK